MANDEVIGPRKTMFVLVIVVGCFAVLWPRILSPLVLGPTREQIQPNQFDREAAMKQERASAMRGLGPHPALRERGRAIPPGPPGPPPPPAARPVTLPPHVRVRSPLSVYYEVEQPPPIPGMRPPLGSPGGPVPAPKSSMGFVMPIYTICIIVFFVYTLSKILFRRTASPYEPVAPDPQFRRRVFRDDSRTSPDKLGKKEADTIVTAISGLVAEVQQQMEASYAQNQQRQDVQDNSRPYTNGTILLNTGPVQIVASEFKEVSKEKSPEPVNDKETTPEPKEAEPTKVDKEPSHEVDAVITELDLESKESSSEVEKTIPELERTLEQKESTLETVVVNESSPEPTITYDHPEPIPQPKELSLEHELSEKPTPDPILESTDVTLDQGQAEESISKSIVTSELKESSPQTKELLAELGVLNETIKTTLISDPKEFILGTTEPSLEPENPASEFTEPLVEPRQTPEAEELSLTHKEPTSELTDPLLEPKEHFPESQEPLLDPNEFTSDIDVVSSDPKDLQSNAFEPEVKIPEHKALISNIDETTPAHKEHNTYKESAPDLIDISQEVDAPSVEHIREPELTEHSSEISAPIERSLEVIEMSKIKEPTSQSKESTPEPNYNEEPKPTLIDDSEPVPEQTILDLEEAIADINDATKESENLNAEHPEESIETEVDVNVELMKAFDGTDELDDGKDDLAKVTNNLSQEDRFVLVRRSTPDVIEENKNLRLVQDQPAEEYKLYQLHDDEEDVENAAVKVVGMETTAHPVGGGEWPRDQRPPAPASPPPPRAPHEAPEVQAIYLQTEIPQQSRVLVAQFEEDHPDRPAKHAPLVVSGKMTLSLIQDAPRQTPERDPESTLDEFTTASAVTQPAAEKEELESDEEIEEEIEVEELELEEEEEEVEEDEEDEEELPQAAAKAAAKK